jgi:hypothetical protein
VPKDSLSFEGFVFSCPSRSPHLDPVFAAAQSCLIFLLSPQDQGPVSQSMAQATSLGSSSVFSRSQGNNTARFGVNFSSFLHGLLQELIPVVFFSYHIEKLEIS